MICDCWLVGAYVISVKKKKFVMAVNETTTTTKFEIEIIYMHNIYGDRCETFIFLI